MNRQEFLALARLEAEILETWVAAGWLIPEDVDGSSRFSELDLARAQLINDLKDRLSVNDAGVDVVLHLVDQLHGLRLTMQECLSTMRAQPDDLRERLANELNRAMTRRFPS
jgi:chaperone modulatory protein CbpM